MGITIWPDAQHQYVDIAQQAPERTALHAVAAVVATVATGRIRPGPTPRRGAVAGGLPAGRGRDGLAPGRQ